MKILNSSLAAILALSLSACGSMCSSCHDGIKNEAATMPCHKKMSPEEIEKNFKASMMSSEHHKALEQLVGNFSVTSKFWMDPTKAPEVNKGTAKHTAVYGGKFVKIDYDSKTMGQPFFGTGYYGYNNVTDQYESNWIDSMSTGIGVSKGTYDADTKTFTFLNDEVVCPATKMKTKVREVFKVIDKDNLLLEMYSTPEGMQEMKQLEIAYKRKK